MEDIDIHLEDITVIYSSSRLSKIITTVYHKLLKILFSLWIDEALRCLFQVNIL